MPISENMTESVLSLTLMFAAVMLPFIMLLLFASAYFKRNQLEKQYERDEKLMEEINKLSGMHDSE